jgi:F-type H+-transporting ATPase subunit b
MTYRLILGLLLAATLVVGLPALGHAAGAGPVDLNPLSPDKLQGDLAIWTAVVFLLLMLVLRKYAWGPLTAGLDKREHGIAQQIEQAEAANRQAKQLLTQYEQRLLDAKDEVRGILEQARRDAERVGQQVIAEAKAQGAAERERALKQIDTATSVAMKEIADQAAGLAVDLAGKIVRAKLNPRDHAQMIEQAVADFARSRN